MGQVTVGSDYSVLHPKYTPLLLFPTFHIASNRNSASSFTKKNALLNPFDTHPHDLT